MRKPRLPTGFLPGRHIIDGYGAGGFRFAEMSHKGSILILPSGIYPWNVKTETDIFSFSFEAVFAESSEIDMFLLGCGKDMVFVPAAFRQSFKDHTIGLETMPTAAAARTYNVLLSENRRVGCALIAVD